MGLALSSQRGANSLLSSANRVKPQSLSSALNLWFAAAGQVSISRYSDLFCVLLTVHNVHRGIVLVP